MKTAKKTIAIYYLLSTVSRFGASFIFATYVTFLIGRGLNLFQVNMVNTAYYVAIFLTEIPTGAFADVYGRKASYLFSNFLLAVGFFIYGLSGSLLGFIVAEITAAISRTFESGAYQAWLVDSLKHTGFEGSLNRIFAKETAYGTIACIAGSMIGSRLADLNPALPWFCGSGVMIVSVVLCSILMREEYFTPRKVSIRQKIAEMKRTVKKSVNYARTDSIVRFMLTLGFVQMVCIQAANMQWQPYFLSFVKAKANLGYIWAGISIAVALGSLISNRFLKRIGDEKQSLVLSQIGIAVGIALAGAVKIMPLAICIFILHEVARGIFKPLHDVYLNDNIKEAEERATIISCGSIVRHLGGIIGLLLSGMFVVRTSISMTWVVSGCALILGTILVAKKGRGA